MTARPQISLDGSWSFWPDPANDLSPAELAGSPAHTITVPGVWQAQFPDLRFYSGTAWYRRVVDVPADWLAERAVVLHIGASDYFTEVWVNDMHIGRHEGGYLPFEWDVAAALHAGENTITIRVDDPPDLFPEIPHGKQSWYGPLSGIWQTVRLEARARVHVVKARITPVGDQVKVAVTLNRALGAGQRLRYEISAPDGSTAAQVTTDVTHVTLTVLEPLLWDTDTPHLYTLRVSIVGESGEIDGLTERFGFRTVETRNGQIWLNGRPIFLRGALDQDYYPEMIYTPPSVEFIEDQFRKAKEMGLNCLRIHIKVGDPRYYEAADRMGILIWTELPNWQTLTADARQRAHDMLTAMVERDWNHPSIIIWTIINESWGLDLTNPEHRVWLGEMYDYLKQLDPHRLAVGNSACYGNFHVVSDLADFHNYYAMPDHHRKSRHWIRTFAGRPAWAFAHPYENYSAWKAFLKRPWKVITRTTAPEVRQRGDEPLIVSEFGNWGLPDVDQLYACYGGEPWWFETGSEWSDGVVYPHGIEKRFKQFGLDSIFPTLKHLTDASQQLQIDAFKYQIEQIRLQPSLTGFVITEFTDVHWESNGLLDMCRNPKLITRALGQINGDDLIIPDWRRLAYYEGERCRISLSISHYSRHDLRDCRLEWAVDGFDALNGTIHPSAVSAASVTVLGDVVFRSPSVAEPTRTHMRFTLIAANGETVASNEQVIFFFPPRALNAKAVRIYAPTLADWLGGMGYSIAATPDEAEMLLVEALTDDLRELLRKGSKVLWLAERASSLQTHLADFGLKKRKESAWQGDWASTMSWVRQDKMFRRLPTQGVADFLFADIMPDCVIRGPRPHEFNRQVHAGMFVGWVHKSTALIAEQRIGQGRLLVSTFRLAEHIGDHPVAGMMLDDMIDYLHRQ